MARQLTRATIILIAATATVSACASATTTQARSARSGDVSDVARVTSTLSCAHGTAGFAFSVAGGGTKTAAQAVAHYVAGIKATDPIARYVSRSTKWTVVPDSDGKTFIAPNVTLHVIRLPTGWIVDSGNYCR